MPAAVVKYNQSADPHLKFIDGKPTIHGFPKGSSVCISSLPSRREVISTRASGSYTPSELDPGKYEYCISKNPVFNNPHRVWTVRGQFLVDVNEDEYQRLIWVKPRFAKGITTTQGARWDCGIERCSEQFTSIIAAVQHEGEHLGVDFLHTSPDEVEDAILKTIRDKQVNPPAPGISESAARDAILKDLASPAPRIKMDKPAT